MKNTILTILFLGLCSCASVVSVSLTPIPAERSRPVSAEVSKFIILGFNFNNDFVDEVVENLKEKCPNGVVSGILTKDELISYFLAHTRKITAKGFCHKTGTSVSMTQATEGGL